ncbi:MAG: permease-like cell division protein FtsX [Patescibacteria group bacterium]
MFWVKLKRISKAALLNFSRNGVVSLTSLLVMSSALFVFSSLIMGGAILRSSLDAVRDKVDINVYFRIDAPEAGVLALADNLKKLPEVKEIQYVSREQALIDFRARHADNSLITQSLKEIGSNPLGASLNIKAKEPSQYESISKFLESDAALGTGGLSIVEKVNYRENKVVIERLSNIIDSAQTLGVIVALLFAIMAIAVTFNTIRLAIYTSREEISVMRLVGASNNFVRGPFIIEGALGGVLSAIFVMMFLYPVSLWVGRATSDFLGGINIYSYYTSNLFELFGVLILSGVALGTVSSFLAVRRYLKV